NDLHQIAGVVDHAAGPRHRLGAQHGVGDAEGDQGVVVAGAGQVGVHLLVGAVGVEVVGVDGGHGAVDGGPDAQNGVGRAQRLLASGHVRDRVAVLAHQLPVQPRWT